MDAVLLDTDVFSYQIKGDPRFAPYEKHVAGKLRAISFVTVGELLSGAQLRGWGARNIAKLESAIKHVVIVPYDLDVCGHTRG